MSASRTLRVVTYNVHRCQGYDRQVSTRRIADVLAGFEPDIIALQELDVARARTGGHDQPLQIAEILRMRVIFHPAYQVAEERYGDAILTHLPMTVQRVGPLPHIAPGETRGALWVRIDVHGRAVHVFNTHLGLNGRERLLQIGVLLGPDWLGAPACTGPRLLCGDFNAWPGTRAYRLLADALADAQGTMARGWPRNTFPARLPVLRIDHIFHSPEFTVRNVRVPRTALTRLASDHLPVIAEIELL